MIKRRRPEEESDEASEADAAQPSTQGQEAPESTDATHPEGTGQASADPGETADTPDSNTAADESTPSDDAQGGAASSGRKRNRRRRGKAATGGSETTTDGESAPAVEAAASPNEPDADTSATASDTGSGDETSSEADTGGATSDSHSDDGGDGATGELPPGSPPPRRGGRGLAVFALLIALAAAGAAGWFGWRVLQLERQVAAVPEQREQALAPLASQDALDSVARRLERGLGSVEDMQQRLSEVANAQQRLQGEHEAVLDDLRTRLETVEAALENLRDQRERDGSDWRMAEVRYLVSIAVQRLAISNDIAGAVAALKAADRSLARMGDPRVIELRKRIVDDIETLEAIEPADVEGIALRIQNLAPRIPHLEPPAPPEPQPAPEPEPAADASDDESTQGWWGAIREQVGSLVSVRREAEPDVPSSPAAPSGPPPSAELPAGERLLLVLKDASRAALNHAPEAYDQAIGRALELLNDEYAESAPVVDRFRDALEELQGRRVTTDLPDLAPTFERTEALAAKLERGGSGTDSQGDN